MQFSWTPQLSAVRFGEGSCFLSVVPAGGYVLHSRSAMLVLSHGGFVVPVSHTALYRTHGVLVM